LVRLHDAILTNVPAKRTLWSHSSIAYRTNRKDFER
jgi:hypothetical protein